MVKCQKGNYHVFEGACSDIHVKSVIKNKMV